MGAKLTKSVHTKQSVVAYPTTVYTLEYKATLSRWNPNYTVKKSHITKSYENLNDPAFWNSWLENMMRDALLSSIENTTGEDVHITESPPITDIEVNTDDILDTNNNTVTITGWIRWKSYSVDLGALISGMHSQLDGGLSYECIRDTQEKWSCLFYPSGLWRNRA